MEVDVSVADLLARADAAPALPKLGGMARPNGVVIVSERYWAFATTVAGELHEGEMPVRRSRAARIPLVRGLLQLASSMAPLVRGRGVARLRERLFLLAALLLPFAFVALPGRLELAAGILTTALIILWLFRGRTLRLHGAEHRAIAAAEAGSLAAHVDGRGAADAVLGPLRHQLRRARDPRDGGLRPPRAAASSPPRSRERSSRSSRSASRWSSGRRSSIRPALLRGFLLPGLALQRLTTREPQLADTQIALRAVASVLRREL